MSTDRMDAATGWRQGRLLAVVLTAALSAALLVAGIGYGTYRLVSDQATVHTAPPSRRPTSGAQVGRDAIAAAPMLAVGPDAGQPSRPTAETAPTITVPAARTLGPADVPAGFPPTVEGAVGQLAAVEVAVLQAMSIPHAAAVYRGWALPGGMGPERWRLTRNVQAFLGAAQLTALGPSDTVQVTPAAAQVKGVDGPDWAVVCVLVVVEAHIDRTARAGYGYCERMQWHDGRWMIAPGAPPVDAPSTWPGTDVALRAGWRSWTPAADVAGPGGGGGWR